MFKTTKKIVALSAVAALATASFAADDVDSRLSEMEAKIQKLEKQLKKAKENISEVKIQANNDNIKWDVDFRTALDSIHYKRASGAESSNPDLLTNRLWLGMGYAPDENNLFKGKLSYFKAYGDTANHSQSNTKPGYADFDWVTNENATDNTVKVKEAYWLYMDDELAGAEIPWTVSFGRRPSTDGLGINMREGMKENSPLSHTVNVEFDGASAKFTLAEVTGVEGMWFKLCTGRGLTNAKPRFSTDGAYASDSDGTHDNNMYGFIFVPWDNGQYSVHTNFAKAENMIGFSYSDITDGDMKNNKFVDVGDLTLITAMVKAEGIGDGISDFLDDTRLFVSWAMSKTDPSSEYANDGGMLGSSDSQTGHSEWIGINMPCLLTEDGRIGIEWNQGSKYWRSVTYGEDTMSGSKIAARGTAWEVYYTKPLTKALTLNARYTKIDYDYTGSQAFFGDDGTPYDLSTINSTNASTYGDPVKESSDFRLSISYRF